MRNNICITAQMYTSSHTAVPRQRYTQVYHNTSAHDCYTMAQVHTGVSWKRCTQVYHGTNVHRSTIAQVHMVVPRVSEHDYTMAQVHTAVP